MWTVIEIYSMGIIGEELTSFLKDILHTIVSCKLSLKKTCLTYILLSINFFLIIYPPFYNKCTKMFSQTHFKFRYHNTWYMFFFLGVCIHLCVFVSICFFIMIFIFAVLVVSVTTDWCLALTLCIDFRVKNLSMISLAFTLHEWNSEHV